MSRKAKTQVCDRGCFQCVHPDCICDDGPNLEEFKLSEELDRFAWLQAQGLDEEHSKWLSWYRSSKEFQRAQRAAKMAAYRESNRAACNAKGRAYRAANRERINAYQRAYYARKKAERG